MKALYVLITIATIVSVNSSLVLPEQPKQADRELTLTTTEQPKNEKDRKLFLGFLKSDKKTEQIFRLQEKIHDYEERIKLFGSKLIRGSKRNRKPQYENRLSHEESS